MALEILVVDDEADIRELVSGVLEDEGFAVRTAADSTTALDAVETIYSNILKALPQAAQDSLGEQVPFPRRLGEPSDSTAEPPSLSSG